MFSPYLWFHSKIFIRYICLLFFIFAKYQAIYISNSDDDNSRKRNIFFALFIQHFILQYINFLACLLSVITSTDSGSTYSQNRRLVPFHDVSSVFNFQGSSKWKLHLLRCLWWCLRALAIFTPSEQISKWQRRWRNRKNYSGENNAGILDRSQSVG